MPHSFTNINFKNFVLISDHEFVIEFTYRYRVHIDGVYKDGEGNFCYAFDPIFTELIEHAQREYAAGALKKPQSFAKYRKEMLDERQQIADGFDQSKDHSQRV